MTLKILGGNLLMWGLQEEQIWRKEYSAVLYRFCLKCLLDIHVESLNREFNM